MANSITFGVLIGGAVSSAFTAAFGAARSTVVRLGAAIDEMTNRRRSLDPLSQQYIQLGRTIDNVRLAAHEAQALVLGSGDYKGWFVLTEVQGTARQTDAQGDRGDAGFSRPDRPSRRRPGGDLRPQPGQGGKGGGGNGLKGVS